MRKWVLTQALQERGFKLFQYLNLDGVMVCALVYRQLEVQGSIPGSDNSFPLEILKTEI